MDGMLPETLKFRNSEPSDHPEIIDVVADWWGGRDLRWMLPKLFLIHFCNSSFVVKKEDRLVAFLVGFLSPSKANEGYIHFVGVHPGFRGIGVGRFLYARFFDFCLENGRHIIRACTSPVNKQSIVFHQKLGFTLSIGDNEIDGIPVTRNYNKPGDDKVLFEKSLQSV